MTILNRDAEPKQASPVAFARARRHLARAQAVLPRGVSSAFRADLRPVPPVIDRAAGSRIWDVDGREYLDYVGAYGPALLGHTPPELVDAVAEQLPRGVLYGGPHPGELELAERIVEIVPSAEIVSLCNSGSEAVQQALRVARAATGRPCVLRFTGHYHGWIEPMLASSEGPKLAADGDVITIAWNDPDRLRAAVEQHAGRLAAILMEAVPCNRGAFLPAAGYLELARELSDRLGVVLIFDEVISGFRLAAGGAQELTGVTPDLTVLAKALGGGVPIAAIAGRRSVMGVASDGPLRLLGTYNGHPLGVAAANAVLRRIERDVELYGRLEALGDRLQRGLLDAAGEAGVPLGVNRVGSVLQLTWGVEGPVADHDAFLRSDAEMLAALAEQLLLRGVHTMPRGLWFVSAAHDAADVDATLTAAAEALRAL